jgi:hypothetical protein
MIKVEIISLDEKLGIILPEREIDRLNLEVGDELVVSEFPGGILLEPQQPQQARALRRTMRENRDVLNRLADS